jgi:membrane complex biogenesis BtpA family protein
MLAEIFKKPKPILGKIQLLALPGAPGWEGHWETLIMRAEQEAAALATGGVDGLIIENFHDIPYTAGRMDVAGAIAMTLLAKRLKQFTALPIGISVLCNDPETALAISMNVQADFMRVSVLTGALMTDGGIVNSRLNELLHYKNHLKVNLPPLLVDISHAHMVPGFVSSKSTDKNAAQHLIDAILTLPDNQDRIFLALSDRDLSKEALSELKQKVTFPILIENESGKDVAEDYFNLADGLILDGEIRKSSILHPELTPTIDMARVETLVNQLRQIPPVSEMNPELFLKR